MPRKKKQQVRVCLFWGMLLLGVISGCASLEKDRVAGPTGLPIITEISPAPMGQMPPWIELRNPTDTRIRVQDFSLVINDKFEYVLPRSVSVIPPKAFILLQFDGRKTASYKFKDGLLVLHLPDRFRSAMGPHAGQIAIYSKDRLGRKNLVDFVAWGAPASKESLTPERHRIWRKEWFVPQVQTFGDYDESMLTQARNFTIARYPGRVAQDPSDWVVLYGNERTPGEENRIPGVGMFTLGDDAVVRSEDISVGWTSSKFAQKYRFQIARDASFQQMVEDVMLTEPLYRPASTLPEGQYYYRVKVIDAQGRQSAWSRTMRVNSKRMGRRQDGKPEDGTITHEVLLNAMQFKHQKKDTQLLCLDGCASHLDGSTAKHWDNVHPEAVPLNGDHGDMNCVRASISMMVSFYGKILSQDRIAFFTQEERTGVGNNIPEGDLAHRDGMGYSAEETAALEWALDETIADFVDTPNPTFSDLKGWLDASRPIMTRTPGHLRAMNGYREEDDGTEWVHIMDPWSGPRWETYTTWNGDARGTWVGPVSAPHALEDEDSIWQDADSDGIMDFDEQTRFITGQFDGDSDNDSVNDKEDAYEYVYQFADVYAKRNADFDADGVRKECDPDNDGDTFNDGCEDENGNGIFESASGETNNFAANAGLTCGEQPIHSIIVFDRSGSMVYPPSDPIKKYDRAADAATLFLDTWLANDVPAQTKIGLVYYDHAAHFDGNPASATTLDLLTEAKRDKIVASFAANRPDYGSTSIGGGILKAMEAQGFNVAATPVDDQHRVIVVLTDGMENTNPQMDDAAVTQALVDNKVDGYALGIGDETEIDVGKLDTLAGILNHPPASLAKDLAAFEMEKFFLQVLAETQGMEFSTDPVSQITIGRTETRAVPVNAGAECVTFVVVWNEDNAKIEFTLKDPANQAVAADVTRMHSRYQISTKESPRAGQWTLTLTASVAGTPAPTIIHYSLMALEKNSTIKSHFQIRGGHWLAGSPLHLIADLSREKTAFRNGRVTVQVQHPTVGLGTFVAKAEIPVPERLSAAEKDAVLTPLDRKYQAMAAKGMDVPRKTVTVTLNDQGEDGDEIPGDGRYTGTFKQTQYDGVYTFRFTASGSGQGRRPLLNREKVLTAYLRPQIDPKRSSLTVLQRQYRPTEKHTYLRLTIAPQDSFGNNLGPGQADLLKFGIKDSRVLKVVDKLDGTYELELVVPGEYAGEPHLLSTFRHLDTGGKRRPVK